MFKHRDFANRPVTVLELAALWIICSTPALAILTLMSIF